MRYGAMQTRATRTVPVLGGGIKQKQLAESWIARAGRGKYVARKGLNSSGLAAQT